jgi:hypothetical protein
MIQFWLVPRLRSWLLPLALFSQLIACQDGGTLQGNAVRPGDQKPAEADKDNGKDDPEAEKISPPSNIIGSYLVCIEQEQLTNIQQNATLHCGVYRDSAHTSAVSVASLNQWQLTGVTSLLRSVTADSATIVEVQFQAADLNGLKQAVRKARLSVQDDAGNSYQGFVADLLPAESRLASVNATKTANLIPVWNEGFEGTSIATDIAWFHDPKTFAGSVVINWANPAAQNAACGLPLFEVMRFANQSGSTDTLGAAEGQQFMDTDSACWPEGAANAIRGASNLAVSKSLALLPGRVYRVSFKVRQQPLPPGFTNTVQGLQLKINNRIVSELRNFSSTWQEVSFNWVAGSGTSILEWVDVGAADDSIGVLLDDLKVQFENF